MWDNLVLCEVPHVTLLSKRIIRAFQARLCSIATCFNILNGPLYALHNLENRRVGVKSFLTMLGQTKNKVEQYQWDESSEIYKCHETK